MSLRAALAAVPGAALLWAAGAWWWSTGVAGAVFSRDVGPAQAVVLAAVLAHLVAPLDADWPPVAVAVVLVATCALVVRRSPVG